MKNNIFRLLLFPGFILLSFASHAQFNHTFSGTAFPSQSGNFKYVGQRQYDADGKDISVSYEALGIIELTHYIYPSKGIDLLDHFNDYKKMLLAQKRKAKILSAEDVTTGGISGKFSKMNFYDNFHGTNQTLTSYLYMYESKGWFIMLRITCISGEDVKVEKEISEYISDMHFPGIEAKK
jgi:hypothetical protein